MVDKSCPLRPSRCVIQAATQPVTKRGRKSTSSTAASAPAASAASAASAAAAATAAAAAAAAAPRSRLPEGAAPIANGGGGAAGAAAGRPPLAASATSRTPARAGPTSGRGPAGAAGAAGGGPPPSSQKNLPPPAVNAAAGQGPGARPARAQPQPQAPPSGASSPVPAARLRRVTGPGSTNGDDDSGGDGGGGGSRGGSGGGDQVAGANGLAGIRWRAVASRGKDAWAVVCDSCPPGEVRWVGVRCQLLCLNLIESKAKVCLGLWLFVAAWLRQLEQASVAVVDGGNRRCDGRHV